MMELVPIVLAEVLGISVGTWVGWRFDRAAWAYLAAAGLFILVALLTGVGSVATLTGSAGAGLTSVVLLLYYVPKRNSTKPKRNSKGPQ